MANQPELDQFDAGVYQLEKTDPVLAGLGGVTNAPLVNLSNRTRYLFNRIQEMLGISKNYVAAGGTANAITCSYTPTVTAVASGQVLKGKVSTPNTGATTFTPNPAATGGISPLPVYGQDLQPLAGGEIVGQFSVQYDAALNGGNGGYVLIDNPGGIVRRVSPSATDNSGAVSNTSWVRTLIAGILAAGVSVGSLASAGTVNGVNNPNLQFNGSGEFGAAGWTLISSFAPQVDSSGAIGTFFSNSGAVSGLNGSDAALQVPVGQNVAVCAAIDIANYATAGSVNVSMAAFNSAGTFIGNVASVAVPNGAGLTRYSLSGTTPANTACVTIYVNFVGVSAPSFGIVFRRLKVEKGFWPSLYSTETNDRAFGSNPPVPLSVIFSSIQAIGKINGTNSPNLEFNGSGEFGSAGWTLTGSFVPAPDTSGGLGTYFVNTGALTNFTGDQTGQNIPMVGGVPVVRSIDVQNNATSGTVALFLDAFNSSNVYVGTVATTVIVNGTGGFQRFAITGTTPGATAYIKPILRCTNVNAAAFTIVFKRGKTENGTTPSLYSQEANISAGTAPQFDISSRLSTTAFVAASLGSFAGAASYSSNTILTPANVGQTIVAGAVASPMTWTPPALAAVPIGAAITVVNISSYPLTFTPASGADRFIASNSPLGTATSYVVPYGSTVTLVKYQANTWLAVGSSADLTGPLFSMLYSGGTGYQKLPSGIIIQWGSSLTTNGQLTQTLPIAFPVSQLAATACVYGGAAAIVTSISSLTQTQVVVNAYTSSTGAASGAVNVSWIAIGR